MDIIVDLGGYEVLCSCERTGKVVERIGTLERPDRSVQEGVRLATSIEWFGLHDQLRMLNRVLGA